MDDDYRGSLISASLVQPGAVSLTDLKSKFGTTVNGKKMVASQKMELHRDDIITFGQGPAVAHISRFR